MRFFCAEKSAEIPATRLANDVQLGVPLAVIGFMNLLFFQLLFVFLGLSFCPSFPSRVAPSLYLYLRPTISP
jgi:hypothetical protein